MADRKTTIRSFSTCALCGHFLATLVALAGDRSLDEAIRNCQGCWLEWEWQPAMAEALAEYYDLCLEAGVEQFSGLCPVCRRQIVYRSSPEGACLQLETLPGCGA